MKYFLILALCFYGVLFYANTITDNKESNGNIVRTITFSPGDEEFESLQKMELTYNNRGMLISRKLLFNDQYSKKTDIVCQEEMYNPLGTLEKYYITFTDDYYAISGVYMQIENVDKSDNIIDVEYHSKDKHLFREKFQNRQTKFPFYKLSFLNKVMFEDYVENPNGTNYGISMKYVSATSIITFIEKPIPLNDKDKDFLSTYLKSRKAENVISAYTMKVLVQEDDKKYYVMFQNQSLQYIEQNAKAAISHYFGTRNKELMILCVGFTDIK